MKQKRGFTIIELMTVLVVVGILFVVTYASLSKSVTKTKETDVRADFASYQLAMEVAMRETKGSSISESDMKLTVEKHLDKGMRFGIKKDMFDNPYEFIYTGDVARVVSAGVDGIMGTGDDYLVSVEMVDGKPRSSMKGF